jgi:hypothetical protein
MGVATPPAAGDRGGLDDEPDVALGEERWVRIEAGP